MLAIQSASPEIAQWSASDYEQVAAGAMAGWVMPAGDNIAGFLIARRVESDLEILNFAVRESARRRGVGAALLAQALGWAKYFGGEKAYLEVRASNRAALDFYLHHNFQITGRRARYYANPPDDALLLESPLA